MSPLEQLIERLQEYEVEYSMALEEGTPSTAAIMTWLESRIHYLRQEIIGLEEKASEVLQHFPRH